MMTVFLRLTCGVQQGLEGFQLVEKMGDGAFSNVYKAIDKLSGQKVAGEFHGGTD
jgi:serine/threonine protein kinase